MEKLGMMGDEDLEAPEGSPLGRYAFAQSRIDKKLPLEKNTRVEQELLDALERHVVDEEKLSKRNASLIQQLMRDRLYTKTIHEPPLDSVVYRGMGVEPEWIISLIGEDEFWLKKMGVVERDFVFEPKNDTSSWTTSTINAATFSSVHGFKGVEITLQANVSDNRFSFVDCNNGLYNVVELSGLEREKEVIGIGNINVSKIIWRKTRFVKDKGRHK